MEQKEAPSARTEPQKENNKKKPIMLRYENQICLFLRKQVDK